MQELVACVVGLSNNEKELFGTRPGLGKSCLCFRFAYPGYDGYIDTHPSLLALHEFENPVINSTHFLYWGSPEKLFPTKGGEVRVRFHILEHTVFYQDITSHPFNSLTKPDNVHHYKKRIVGPIESSRKLSYHSRDDIGTSASSQYPSNLTKQQRGYIVVFDVSLAGKELEMQCHRVEPILEYLCKSKKKLVLAATKRDCYQVVSLEKAYELQKKFRIPLIETSTSEDLNVTEAFRILAKQALTKNVQGMSDKVQDYDKVAKYSRSKKEMEKRAFTSFVKKKCKSCDDRLSSVMNSEEYKECAYWLGSFQTGLIFALNALKLKVDSCAGILDKPSLRQGFLEGFVDSREDLTKYRTNLKMWITEESTLHDITVKTLHTPEEVTGGVTRSLEDLTRPTDTQTVPPAVNVVPQTTSLPLSLATEPKIVDRRSPLEIPAEQKPEKSEEVTKEEETGDNYVFESYIDSRPCLEIPVEEVPQKLPDLGVTEEEAGEEAGEDDDFDYDYPNVCSADLFKGLAHKMDVGRIFNGAQKKVHAQRYVGPWLRTDSNDSFSYVPMRSVGDAKDDSYVCYSSHIQHLGHVLVPSEGQEQSHPCQRQTAGKQHAKDDLYVNFPTGHPPVSQSASKSAARVSTRPSNPLTKLKSSRSWSSLSQSYSADCENFKGLTSNAKLPPRNIP